MGNFSHSHGGRKIYRSEVHVFPELFLWPHFFVVLSYFIIFLQAQWQLHFMLIMCCGDSFMYVNVISNCFWGCLPLGFFFILILYPALFSLIYNKNRSLQSFESEVQCTKRTPDSASLATFSSTKENQTVIPYSHGWKWNYRVIPL